MGRNPGGILISCQSKQKRGEVTRYLLPPPDPTPPPGPRPAPFPAVCWAQCSGARLGQTPGSSSHGKPLPSYTSSTPGPGVGFILPAQPWSPALARTLQRPLDEAFAVVGNGFSEDFVCQRRKLGWNLQEESLRGMAKNYYISFPEGASNCAGTQ